MHELPSCPSPSPKLRIEATFGSSYCECCGSSDWANADITVGADELAAYYDGHLGGGNWSGEVTELYLWALAMAGVQVEVRLPDGSVDQVLDVPHFEEPGPSSLPRAVRNFAEKAPLRLEHIELPVPLDELDDWTYSSTERTPNPLIAALEGLLGAIGAFEFEVHHEHEDAPPNDDFDGDDDSEEE